MKKQFKVQLFSEQNYAAELLVLAAARSNAGWAKTDLQMLKSMGEGMKETFPDLHPQPTTFELIDNRLHIDCKGLNGWEQAAIIEEVEVFEIHAGFEEKEEAI